MENLKLKFLIYYKFLNELSSANKELDIDYDRECCMASGCGDSEIYETLDKTFSQARERLLHKLEKKYNVDAKSVQKFMAEFLVSNFEKVEILENLIGVKWDDRVMQVLRPKPEEPKYDHSGNIEDYLPF